MGEDLVVLNLVVPSQDDPEARQKFLRLGKDAISYRYPAFPGSNQLCLSRRREALRIYPFPRLAQLVVIHENELARDRF